MYCHFTLNILSELKGRDQLGPDFRTRHSTLLYNPMCSYQHARLIVDLSCPRFSANPQTQHPRIVVLYGTDKDEECLYFIMEAAVGGALHHHIRHSPGGCFDTCESYS